MPPRATFWLVAAATAIAMLGTTLPTPLYVLYGRNMGFGTATVTVVFAVYAGGVLLALLLFGELSDVIGRRRVLLLGLGFALISAVVFLNAHHLALLLTGRLLSGLSAGLFTATATAALLELAGDREGQRASLVSTVATMGGLGAGPILAGVLAESTTQPLIAPFAAHFALAAAVTAGLWFIPETAPAVGWHRRIVSAPSVPRELRRLFAPATTAGFSGFAVLGLFTAVAPAFLVTLLDLSNLALVGAVVSTVFIASAIGQIVLRGSLGIGCALLALSLAVLAGALALESLMILLVAAVLAGLGQGLCFRVGLAALAVRAKTDQRARVSSAYFVAAYVGTSLPVVGAGLAADAFGLRAAGTGFCLATALLSVTALALTRRTRG